MKGPFFQLEQLALLRRCLQQSEQLVGAQFRIPVLPSKLYPYELASLPELEPHERAQGHFAHLVVYERARPSGSEHLYRICLQDDAILKRVVGDRAEWLASLLVYVLTHELVHIVRFQRAEQSFHAAAELRQREEDEVHRITLEILRIGGEPHWRRLDELYGNPVIPAMRVTKG